MSLRHRAPALLLASALAAVGALALAAAPAMADQNIYRFVKSFAPPRGFANPFGIAINQSTEAVYVADATTSTVYAFTASGSPDVAHPKLTEADGTTPFPFATPYGVAVDNSGGPNQGDIYVVSQGDGDVAQFDPTGTRTATPAITAADVPAEGTIQSGGLPAVLNNGDLSPVGVAIAANGDIYVADQSNNVVDRFEPNGTFVSQLAAGDISGPNLIAVDHSGNLYVANNANGTVEFDPSGACVNSCTPIDPGAPFGVAIDKEGNVFTDEGSQIAEFNSSAQQLQTFGRSPTFTEPPFGGLSFSFGVAVSESTKDVYVADYSGSKVDVFEPYLLHSAVLPSVGETSSSDLTPTTAILAAQISPGFRPTVYRFQYGTTASYGSSTSVSAPIGFADNVDHLETAQVAGLTPGATYHFRVVAINYLGTVYGPDQAFTTPDLPAVSAASASAVTSSTARLEAQVTPNLAATTYHFDYGPSSSYGTSTAESALIGADNSSHTVSAELSGLPSATTFHFRVVATNLFGTAAGADQTFTTTALPVSVAPKPKACQKGFVKEHGKCVKKVRHERNKGKHKHRAKHHRKGAVNP